ncbi:ABC transporter ATP-binding protein [Azotobacter bryophylli]|uniref:ABC transporter ATP-binding protein n=1 Tax=Azotobacter bryophylli TaxID=1986537 RepID=A0ABV7AU61_9GAMM
MNTLSKIGMVPLVELRRVTKRYQIGEKPVIALKGIDFVIQPREFVAIWGPSGSGKSTLCNLIGMLDSPTTGNVLIDGEEVNGLTDNARSELRNRNIGFVFQSFNLVPVLSALENVMLPLQISGAPVAEARERALQRLAEVGLEEHVAHRPAKLSGGQQQRVAIARALVTDPALVIADEPTANLDSGNARRIIELMLKINSRQGTAFVFSTHDQRLLESVKRRVQMEDGVIGSDSMPPRSAQTRIAGTHP